MKKFSFTIIFLFFAFHASAQINLAAIDTAIWDVDTLNKSLIVRPRERISIDTTIYFYSIVKNKKENVLNINIRNKWVSGSFSGTAEFPHKCSYLKLNQNIEKLDSISAFGLVDTIVKDTAGISYCIKLSSIEMNEVKYLDGNTFVHNNYFTIYYVSNQDDLFYGLLYGKLFVEENEVPYNVLSYSLIKDFD